MRPALIITLLLATSAHARFGKANSDGGSTHKAAPASSRSSSSSSSSSSGSGSGSSGSSGSGFLRPTRGYLWNQAYRTPWWAGAAPAATPALVAENEELARITLNADFMAIVVAPEVGYTFGLNGGLEGEYFGLQFSAQSINVKARDSAGGMDQLSQFATRLSYAFLSGERGRIRGEVGADLIFAADMLFFGGTIGFSGVLNIAGPFAFEASLMATVFPFWQLDGRAGFLVATGPLAVRVGWRSQLLDDRGMVDGVVHRDTFHGPTAGFGLAF